MLIPPSHIMCYGSHLICAKQPIFASNVQIDTKITRERPMSRVIPGSLGNYAEKWKGNSRHPTRRPEN